MIQYSGVHQEARILVGFLSNISRDHQQFQFWLRIPRCVVWLRGVMQISQFFENFVYIPRSQTPRCKLHSYILWTQTPGYNAYRGVWLHDGKVSFSWSAKIDNLQDPLQIQYLCEWLSLDINQWRSDEVHANYFLVTLGPAPAVGPRQGCKWGLSGGRIQAYSLSH